MYVWSGGGGLLLLKSRDCPREGKDIDLEVEVTVLVIFPRASGATLKSGGGWV